MRLNVLFEGINENRKVKNLHFENKLSKQTTKHVFRRASVYFVVVVSKLKLHLDLYMTRSSESSEPSFTGVLITRPIFIIIIIGIYFNFFYR